jgi:hypothetical protein
MLYQDDIAGHEVRSSKSGELIVRPVPRLNADQHSKRRVFKARVPGFRFDDLWRQQRLCIIRIILKNSDARRARFSLRSIMREAARPTIFARSRMAFLDHMSLYVLSAVDNALCTWSSVS